MMNVEIVSEQTRLEAVRPEWEQLWQSNPNPYLSWEWQRSWIEAKNYRSRMHILLFRRGQGDLLAVIPLQRLGLRGVCEILTFMGQDTSISPDFLVASGQEEAVGQALLDHVCSRRQTLGLVLKMAEPVVGAACLLRGTAFPAQGSLEVEAFCQRPIVSLAEDFDAYLASLGSKMRQEMRAAGRKLEADNMAELLVDDGGGDFETRMADLFRLNDRRWGQSGGRKVYEDMYRRLRTGSMLRLFVLHVNGRPAAGLSALVAGKTLYAEVAGFDYEVEPRHLGKYFYGRVFRWAMEQGLEYFDFSSGSEEYKLRFNPQIHGKYRVQFTACRRRAALLKLIRAAGRRHGRLRIPVIA